MGLVKSSGEIERMRVAGKITATICDQILKYISPGMTTAEIDRYAAGLIKEYGARSAFLGYRGYPGSICVSLNEEIVHGIPGPRRVQVGDVVTVDIGVELDSYCSDMARTIMISVLDSKVADLVKATEKAFYAGLEKAVAGNRLSDISHAIEKSASAAGFSVVRQFVGHGIGRSVHEEPQIPNFGAPGKGIVLKEAMTLAIEPMLNMGKAEVEILSDGWTAVTSDRKLSSHFENTIMVGGEAAEILTVV